MFKISASCCVKLLPNRGTSIRSSFILFKYASNFKFVGGSGTAFLGLNLPVVDGKKELLLPLSSTDLIQNHPNSPVFDIVALLSFVVVTIAALVIPVPGSLLSKSSVGVAVCLIKF